MGTFALHFCFYYDISRKMLNRTKTIQKNINRSFLFLIKISFDIINIYNNIMLFFVTVFRFSRITFTNGVNKEIDNNLI